MAFWGIFFRQSLFTIAQSSLFQILLWVVTGFQLVFSAFSSCCLLFFLFCVCYFSCFYWSACSRVFLWFFWCCFSPLSLLPLLYGSPFVMILVFFIFVLIFLFIFIFLSLSLFLISHLGFTFLYVVPLMSTVLTIRNNIIIFHQLSYA